MPPPQPFPPHHPQSTTPLTPSAALTNLTTFLAATETQPHLHPDSVLSIAGIAFSAQGGPLGGLVLHNLRRIEKGLGGEILAPEPEAVSDDRVLDGLVAGAETAGEKAGQPLKSALKRRAVEEWNAETEAQEGWQDPEEYARGQAIVEGEVGDRGTHVVEGGEVPVVRVDKEARKEEKKRRRLAEKKERESKRKG